MKGEVTLTRWGLRYLSSRTSRIHGQETPKAWTKMRRLKCLTSYNFWLFSPLDLLFFKVQFVICILWFIRCIWTTIVKFATKQSNFFFLAIRVYLQLKSVKCFWLDALSFIPTCIRYAQKQRALMLRWDRLDVCVCVCVCVCMCMYVCIYVCVKYDFHHVWQRYLMFVQGDKLYTSVWSTGAHENADRQEIRTYF